jgi:integrase
VAETHRSGLWILTLLYTGMRPGETAALTWADIDFERDTIRIHAAKESGSTRIKEPKTKAGIRTLPHIPVALLPKLKAASAGKKPFDPVFPTGQGNFQNENSLRRLWTGFKRDLDIYMGAKLERNKITESVVAPDLVPYCLRHTFATDCARAGVPVDTVRWLMGHEDIATTANIYQDADTVALRNGLMLLESGRRPGDVKSDVI